MEWNGYFLCLYRRGWTVPDRTQESIDAVRIAQSKRGKKSGEGLSVPRWNTEMFTRARSIVLRNRLTCDGQEWPGPLIVFFYWDKLRREIEHYDTE